MQTLYEAFPQTLLNIEVPHKVPFEELTQVQTLIAEIERKHGDNGRVLVRYSGTEMKARVMVEGREADEVRQDADTIAQELLVSISKPLITQLFFLSTRPMTGMFKISICR